MADWLLCIILCFKIQSLALEIHWDRICHPYVLSLFSSTKYSSCGHLRSDIDSGMHTHTHVCTHKHVVERLWVYLRTGMLRSQANSLLLEQQWLNLLRSYLLSSLPLLLLLILRNLISVAGFCGILCVDRRIKKLPNPKLVVESEGRDWCIYYCTRLHFQ